MKPPKTAPSNTPESPVFPKMLHRVRERVDAKTTASNSKPAKRDNIFSKSRDTREDRGARQAKTSSNPGTISSR